MKTKTKKRIKQDLSSYLNSVGLRSFSGQNRRIAEAYSDCLVSDMCEMSNAQRNLNYFETESISAKDLLLVAEHIIGNYNEFNVSQVEKVVHVFGEDALYFIARESSPCIYIKPTRGQVWVDRSNYTDDSGGLNTIKADEVTFSATLGMFRVWWD